MKATVNNVINLWFAADTPIRQYKIKLNPEIWAACERVSKDFSLPSRRIVPTERYRKSEKASFARAVLDELSQTKYYTKESGSSTQKSRTTAELERTKYFKNSPQLSDVLE